MALFSGSAARRIGMWNVLQAQDAERRAEELRQSAQSNALAALGQGAEQARGDLTTQYGGAIDRLNPWTDAGKSALGMYQNSLGLNGAGGNADAVAAFQAGPGYQWQRDQAVDAVARKQSALGALGSGNTMAAITDRASQLANQEYGGWQDRLNGLSNTGMQAAGTQAGLQGQLGSGLASLGMSKGQNEANVYTGLAGLGQNNIWNSQQIQSGSLTSAQKQANDNVNAGVNFYTNLAGTALNLLGTSMGGGSTLGGNMMSSMKNIGTGGLNYY